MKFLATLFFYLVALSSFAKADPPATHGMFLFGDNATYVSHLPMFHAPHNYQLIMEVQMDNMPRTFTNAIHKYNEHKAAGEDFFTIAPQPMDLTKVIDGTITNFKADLFLNHFERAGAVLLGPVLVKVNKIIFVKTLTNEENSSPFEQYIVFGKEGEYYSAHIIDEAPSFDIIAKTEQLVYQKGFYDRAGNFHIISQEKVEDRDLPITIFHSLEIPEKGTTLGKTGDLSRAFLTVVTKVLYLEEDELAHAPMH